jgi:hypothetical protein
MSRKLIGFGAGRQEPGSTGGCLGKDSFLFRGRLFF